MFARFWHFTMHIHKTVSTSRYRIFIIQKKAWKTYNKFISGGNNSKRKRSVIALRQKPLYHQQIPKCKVATPKRHQNVRLHGLQMPKGYKYLTLRSLGCPQKLETRQNTMPIHLMQGVFNRFICLSSSKRFGLFAFKILS